MARVEVRTDGSNRIMDLDGSYVTVGRQADNEIVLSDGLVSRRHAAIERRDGRWVLHDLGSRNGTTLDGRAVKGTSPLLEGSRVVIGDTELVFSGLTFDPGETIERPDPTADGPALSLREREVVALVASGLTDDEIAARLFISVRTVRSHLDRIRDKTGRRRRPDLTRLAHELNLAIDPAV